MAVKGRPARRPSPLGRWPFRARHTHRHAPRLAVTQPAGSSYVAVRPITNRDSRVHASSTRAPRRRTANSCSLIMRRRIQSTLSATGSSMCAYRACCAGLLTPPFHGRYQFISQLYSSTCISRNDGDFCAASARANCSHGAVLQFGDYELVRQMLVAATSIPTTPAVCQHK